MTQPQYNKNCIFFTLQREKIDEYLEKIPGSGVLLFISDDQDVLADEVEKRTGNQQFQPVLQDKGMYAFLRQIFRQLASTRDCTEGLGECDPAVAQQIAMVAQQAKQQHMADLDTIRKGNANRIANLPDACANRDWSGLKAQLKDNPIVIVAAGPTADDDIATLKEHRKHVYVGCVDVMLEPLLYAGITPDIVFGLTWNPLIDEVFNGLSVAPEAILVYSTQYRPNLVKAWKGQKIALNHEYERLLMPELFTDKWDAGCGCTVGHMAIQMAVQCECSEIWLSGHDNCFAFNRWYASRARGVDTDATIAVRQDKVYRRGRLSLVNWDHSRAATGEYLKAKDYLGKTFHMSEHSLRFPDVQHAHFKTTGAPVARPLHVKHEPGPYSAVIERKLDELRQYPQTIDEFPVSSKDWRAEFISNVDPNLLHLGQLWKQEIADDPSEREEVVAHLRTNAQLFVDALKEMYDAAK